MFKKVQEKIRVLSRDGGYKKDTWWSHCDEKYVWDEKNTDGSTAARHCWIED